MGMLDRYKKVGGFVQLLKLIETCDPVKKEKLLKVIQEEDPFWEQLIQKKCLSLERLINWNEDSVATCLEGLPTLTLATALHGLPEEKREQAFNVFGFRQKRNLEEFYSELNPTPGEIAAAFLKVVTHVRGLIEDGKIKLEIVDPDLVIAADIDLLLQSSKSYTLSDSQKNGTSGSSPAGSQRLSEAYVVPPSAGSVTATASPPLSSDPRPEAPIQSPSPAPSPVTAQKLEKVMARVVELTEENSKLKNEIAQLRGRLAQIKRIA